MSTSASYPRVPVRTFATAETPATVDDDVVRERVVSDCVFLTCLPRRSFPNLSKRSSGCWLLLRRSTSSKNPLSLSRSAFLNRPPHASFVIGRGGIDGASIEWR